MWDFEMIRIEPVQPPAAPASGAWFRYTIANPITEISGTRRGSREEVVSFVNQTLQRLNNRYRPGKFSLGKTPLAAPRCQSL